MGFEPLTFVILEQCLTNYTTEIVQWLEVVQILYFSSGYRDD